MKRKLILGFLLLFLVTSSYAQTDKQKAQKLAQTAAKYIDNNAYNQAISLLEQASTLDSAVYRYKYDMAYAYYLKRDFSKALEIMKTLADKSDVNDRVFQLLGNLYDISGDTAKALETYRKGLNKYPKSGLLYSEYGNYYYDLKLYNRALSYYERGIEVAPHVATNYFRAAILYLSSREKIWGLIYGELFMNIEPSTNRTKQISKMMYDIYSSKISIEEPKTAILTVKGKAGNKFLSIYENLVLSATQMSSKWDLDGYCKMREGFIKAFYEKGYNKQYDNVFFDYQKKVLDAGHFDAYSHWLLMEGDKLEFNVWYDKHKSQMDSYTKWLSDNRLVLSNRNAFVRHKFEKR